MTKIEWASLGLPKGVTWNPIRAKRFGSPKGAPDRGIMDGTRTGWYCEKVSPACENCYAERLNAKAGDTGGTGLPYKPGHRQNGDVEIYLDEKTLLAPLSWRAPRGVFVCSMTDLFGDWVPDEWLDRIFAVMALCPQHRFAVLTKRPDRMREYLSRANTRIAQSVYDSAPVNRPLEHLGLTVAPHETPSLFIQEWPLRNVILGVTAEDQQRADERIPDLLATPAAVRFVSIEPMLSGVRLDQVQVTDEGEEDTINALTGEQFSNRTGCQVTEHRALDWVICGGESGPGARPLHPDWARSLRDQCRAASVPLFFKQVGEWECVYDRDRDDPDWRRCPRAANNSERYVNLVGGHGFHGERVVFMRRVGKKRAGRLLDGVEYSEFPEARA